MCSQSIWEITAFLFCLHLLAKFPDFHLLLVWYRIIIWPYIFFWQWCNFSDGEKDIRSPEQLVQGSFHHREKSTIKYKVLSWWWWVKTSQTDKIRWNFYYSNTFSTKNCYLLTGPDLKHLHIRSLASAVQVLVWNTSMRKCLWTSPSEGFFKGYLS